MNTVKAFLKKYWITCCIFIGLVALYIFLTSNGLVNPYLFPSTDKIKAAFIDSKDMMFGNAVASFKLLIPSILLSLLIALFLGTIMGLNQRVREILHPVIYAFSVVPSILLSPFVLLLAPTLFSASVFLIVYNIVWATLFATITGIMTIDKRYLDKAATLTGKPRNEADYKGDSSGSESFHIGRICKFSSKFFCDAGLCGNVWSWRRNGIFRKEICGTWYFC